jgi:hypothetical protein
MYIKKCTSPIRLFLPTIRNIGTFLEPNVHCFEKMYVRDKNLLEKVDEIT